MEKLLHKLDGRSTGQERWLEDVRRQLDMVATALLKGAEALPTDIGGTTGRERIASAKKSRVDLVSCCKRGLRSGAVRNV